MDIVYKLLIVSSLLVINSKINEAKLYKTENYTKCWKNAPNIYYFKGRNIVTSDFSVLYAVCKYDLKTIDQTSKVEKMICNVTIDTPIDKDKSEEKTCQINWPLIGKPSIEGAAAIIDLLRFSGNKVIITWAEKPSLRVSILNLSNCTINHYVKYDSTKIFLTPILSENKFDIFVSDKTMCGELDRCRISYDELGKQIGKKLPFPSRVNFGLTELDPKTNGVYVYGIDDNYKLGMDYVNHDGKVMNFMAEEVKTGDRVRTKMVFSNAHDLLSICWEHNHIHCAQFDKFGKVLLNVTIPSQGVNLLNGVHNLAEGGIIVLISANKGGNDFYIKKVSNNKKIGKPLSIDFGCNSGQNPRLSFNIFETSEYLRFYMLCAHSEMKFSVQHVMKSDIAKTI